LKFEKMKKYKDQAKEVKRLANRITTKCSNFAKQKHDSPYFGDLLSVIEDLKEVDEFLNDKYLNK